MGIRSYPGRNAVARLDCYRHASMSVARQPCTPALPLCRQQYRAHADQVAPCDPLSYRTPPSRSNAKSASTGITEEDVEMAATKDDYFHPNVEFAKAYASRTTLNAEAAICRLRELLDDASRLAENLS